MRSTGHNLETELLRKSLEASAKRLNGDTPEHRQAERDRDAAFFVRRARNVLNYVRLGYLFDVSVNELRTALMLAVAELQKAIQFGGSMLPTDVPRYLAGALLTEDRALIGWIGRLPRKNYTQEGVIATPAHYAYAEAYQALTVGNAGKAAEKIAEFGAALTPDKLKHKPTMARMIPLAALLGSVADADQTRFDRAFKDLHKNWKDTYGKASERGNYDGIIDLEGLGITVLARREGLKIPENNPYVPLELLPPTA